MSASERKADLAASTSRARVARALARVQRNRIGRSGFLSIPWGARADRRRLIALWPTRQTRCIGWPLLTGGSFRHFPCEQQEQESLAKSGSACVARIFSRSGRADTPYRNEFCADG